MKGRAGFTLMEVLVSGALLGIFTTAMVYLITRVRSQEPLDVARALMTDELRTLTNEVRLAWKYRTKPDAAALTVVGVGPFNPSGVVRCQGSIQINQQDPATGAIRTIGFQTTCRPPFPTVVEVERAHPDLNCPGGVSQVTVTRPAGNLVFPATNTMEGVALCFRVQGTNVSVEAGAVIAHRNETRNAADRVVLSTQDRSPGLEYIR